MNELMIRVEPLAQGGITWNREELSGMVDTIVAQYHGLVYTDDQVPEAKKDRANLNKALTAIENERKRIKNAVMEPYTRFEAELKELTGRIKAAMDEIDAQTSAYESQKKGEKKAQLQEFYQENIGSLAALVPFERVFEDRMLNATVSLDKAEQQIMERINKISLELNTIDGLQSEYQTSIKDYYLRTFDLAEALQESKRLATLKRLDEVRQQEEEARRKAAEIPVQDATPPVQSAEAQGEAALEMTFTVYGTLQELRDLKAYMDGAGLKYR